MERLTPPIPQLTEPFLREMTEGLFVLDQAGVVHSANERAAAILDRDLEELIGQHYTAFWPDELPSPAELSHLGPGPHHAVFVQKSRRAVPAAISVNSVSSMSAATLVVTVTASASVERLNDALSHTQKLAGIGTLTASVAHELNTPISVIAATCSNLLHAADSESLSSDQLRQYVKMIERNAWRCARIVGVLKNYTVDDTLHMSVSDLNLIIEDAVTLVRHQFHSDFNVVVETELSTDLRSVICDHNRLTQVLVNLLTNARDAMMPIGGRITVRSWICNTQERDDAAELYAFSVSDSGTGIASELIERIFNPFYTTKTSGKGTGLGLFIAKRIVTQHHGEISAANNPDGGATFTVRLPRQFAELTG